MSARQPDHNRIKQLENLLDRAFPVPISALRSRPMELVRAPGRLNLLGEHTEYNDGFALSVSIELDCWVAFRRRPDGLVRVLSRQTGDGGEFWIDLHHMKRQMGWMAASFQRIRAAQR